MVGPLWYGRQDFTTYSQAALGLGVTALASALYPALRAARLALLRRLQGAFLRVADFSLWQ